MNNSLTDDTLKAVSMKPTILLVEDNKELIEVIAEDLGEQFAVLSVGNGKLALSVLETETVHLVISDVMMPVMDGLELCQSIKSRTELSHIPVILLTAKTSIAAKIEGLGHGADAYIEKPFEMEYLIAVADSLLQNRQKLKALFEQSPSHTVATNEQTSSDDPFLANLTQVILNHIDDMDLDVNKLAKLTDMSRTSLFRKIRTITNLTPNELINLTRLKKAAALLKEGKHRIYEIADLVGYNSQTNFGRNFHKQYGMTPTEYQKKYSMEK